MKKIYLILILSAISISGFSQNCKLYVKYTFLHIVEGYDHTTRCIVFVDGKEVYTEASHKQSAGGSFSITIPQGRHDIKIMNYADDKTVGWEEHTIANNYSQDLEYQKDDVQIPAKGKRKCSSFLISMPVQL